MMNLRSCASGDDARHLFAILDFKSSLIYIERAPSGQDPLPGQLDPPDLK